MQIGGLNVNGRIAIPNVDSQTGMLDGNLSQDQLTSHDSKHGFVAAAGAALQERHFVGLIGFGRRRTIAIGIIACFFLFVVVVTALVFRFGQIVLAVTAIEHIASRIGMAFFQLRSWLFLIGSTSVEFRVVRNTAIVLIVGLRRVLAVAVALAGIGTGGNHGPNGDLRGTSQCRNGDGLRHLIGLFGSRSQPHCHVLLNFRRIGLALWPRKFGVFFVLFGRPSRSHNGQCESNVGKVDGNARIESVVIFPRSVWQWISRSPLVQFFTENSPGDIVLQQVENVSLCALQLLHQLRSQKGQHLETNFGRTGSPPEFQNG
mmetsp:Transcript_8957/g.19322  ORF Transcript_8957/g.19322 Transcript_8957/m.19322 type:complete len:317 (-) Transcript_8957:941-1891(-)